MQPVYMQPVFVQPVYVQPVYMQPIFMQHGINVATPAPCLRKSYPTLLASLIPLQAFHMIAHAVKMMSSNCR